MVANWPDISFERYLYRIEEVGLSRQAADSVDQALGSQCREKHRLSFVCFVTSKIEPVLFALTSCEQGKSRCVLQERLEVVLATPPTSQDEILEKKITPQSSMSPRSFQVRFSCASFRLMIFAE